jgi:hypothetical protein
MTDTTSLISCVGRHLAVGWNLGVIEPLARQAERRPAAATGRGRGREPASLPLGAGKRVTRTAAYAIATRRATRSGSCSARLLSSRRGRCT